MNRKIDVPYLGKCKVYLEQDALKILLKYSTNFKQFYDNERGKIKSYFFWAKCEKLPTGTNAYTVTIFPDRTVVIILPVIPAPTDHAFRVAHELAHRVRVSEGTSFGIGGRDARTAKYADLINSMVEDNKVDSILEKYGFDLETEYGTQLRVQMPGIRSITRIDDEMEAKINYVNIRLRCDLLGKTFEPWSEFEELFRHKFPHLMDSIDQIYNFVKDNDLRTIEKKQELLRVIGALPKS